jgi:hypothetical protein
VSDNRYAHLATRLLAEQQRNTGPASLGDRAGTVAALERALRGRIRRRRWRRIAAGAGAMAAVALLVAVGLTVRARLDLVPAPPLTVVPRAPAPARLTARAGVVRGAGATLVRAGNVLALGTGARLRSGDRLRAGRRGEVRVELSSGTRFGLAGGEMELVGLESVQRFALRTGRLRADVAKLPTGHRFLIATADTEVEVKGTSFEVEVIPPSRCADGATTRVRVFEGVVVVRRGEGEVRVGAGSSWPEACGETAGDDHSAAAALPRHAGHLRALAPRLQSSAEQLAASTLAEQNDLFADALRARRRGDRVGALRRLDELITRFPSGPLAESARARRADLVRGR